MDQQVRMPEPEQKTLEIHSTSLDLVASVVVSEDPLEEAPQQLSLEREALVPISPLNEPNKSSGRHSETTMSNSIVKSHY